MDSVNHLLANEKIPQMARVRQKFDTWRCIYPEAELHSQLHRDIVKSKIQPGMRIAVTAGSRGIDNNVLFLKESISSIKSCGAEPFIIPAMGSHGGASSDGQKKLLEGYGVTQDSVGAPIFSSMETAELGTLEDGNKVYMDRQTYEADGIVLVNRIKPHTGFRGDYESGLLKMACVGLGKQIGAEVIHQKGPQYMFAQVRDFGTYVINHARILFSVGIVENAFDATHTIRVFEPGDILTEEPKLLILAKSLMPRIYFENPDILIIDYIGKNIRWPGMDPNITQTFLIDSGISKEKRARRVVVLDLSKKTHGSVLRIGMADITTKWLVDKMSLDATYPNCLAGAVTESTPIPLFFDNQEYAVKVAIKTLQHADKDNLRIVRIQGHSAPGRYNGVGSSFKRSN